MKLVNHWKVIVAPHLVPRTTSSRGLGGSPSQSTQPHGKSRNHFAGDRSKILMMLFTGLLRVLEGLLANREYVQLNTLPIKNFTQT